MRKYGRKDTNQTEIENVFRTYGFSVFDTSPLGGGFPDVVAGKDSDNYLIEVKDGNKPPSQQKLSDAEIKFHMKWRGNVHVINSVDQAIKFCKEFA